MAAALTNLHVVGLEVSNFMRVRVARLTPGPGLVEVAGSNRNGKTSLLRAIEAALGGDGSIPWEPISLGQEKASIRLDLGNGDGLQLRVTRNFRTAPEGGKKPYTTTLKVELADGARPKGEQTLLNSLMRGLTFDPQSFMDAKPAERVETLKSLVPDFDFVANAAARKGAFEARADHNREVKRLDGVLAGWLTPINTPTALVDKAPIVAALGRIGDARSEFDRETARQMAMTEAAATARVKAARFKSEAAEARATAARLELNARDAIETAEEIEGDIAELPLLEPPPETADLMRQLAEADAINAAVSRANEREAAVSLRAIMHKAAVDKTNDIDALDLSAIQAIERADLPAGLAIVEGTVTLRGVPFEQGSTAEQIRTSIAIGMKLNPDLRVIRIRQGSALDDEAWAIVRDMADSTGFQIWAEVIRPHDSDAIVMVDGEVDGA